MKKLLLLLVLFIFGVVWIRDWITSGKMDNFLMEHAESPRTPKALYRIGEIYYLAQEPEMVIHYYRWITEKYPDHPKMAKVRWNLGQSYEETHQKWPAIEQYAILKDSYPATEFGMLGANRYQQIKY